jgi:hypothetical protein
VPDNWQPPANHHLKLTTGKRKRFYGLDLFFKVNKLRSNCSPIAVRYSDCFESLCADGDSILLAPFRVD